MTFKPNPSSAQCRALPGWSLLRVEGRDAAAFLQAQAMNDVAALAPGHWQWNGLLTPKGRVIALFALLREDEARYLLVLPDLPAAELAAHLQRFVFRSKLQLVPLDGWQVAGGPAEDTADAARAAGHADAGWVLDWRGEGSDRWLWLLPGGHPALAPADPDATRAWLEADLAHGLPHLAPAQREAFTPQMLSLDRLAAFSLKKGCYPGQEIVARTHYLGQAKRGLVRLQGPAQGAPGEPVLATDGRELGLIASAAGRERLAVLPAGHPVHGLQSGGQALTVQPLLDGLAR